MSPYIFWTIIYGIIGFGMAMLVRYTILNHDDWRGQRHFAKTAPWFAFFFWPVALIFAAVKMIRGV